MMGTIAAPQEAWLTQRGIKTLPVRMRQICASAQRVAEFLDGLAGVISLVVDGDADAAGRVCERTGVFTLAVSLGGVESLIEQPARMTHRTTAGSPFGVDPSLLRLSIGLEDCDELIADLDQALAG